MHKKTILVTGANGQLGSEFRQLAKSSDYNFVFVDSNELDITQYDQVDSIFNKYSFDYCINCAAYTQVDKAEVEQELAYTVNVTGVKNLAENCTKTNTVLIHISTDFVFDGTKNNPYTEEDTPNPINYYGKTKYLGELEVQKTGRKYFIIRTSWLYGQFGNNFVKTILRLAKEKKELQIVNTQFGIPTNATDLAEFILQLINTNNDKFGIYHFSNSSDEKISWYDFAKEILKINNITVPLIPASTFPTKAKRPNNTTMDLNKVKSVNFGTKNWKEALVNYMKKKL